MLQPAMHASSWRVTCIWSCLCHAYCIWIVSWARLEAHMHCNASPPCCTMMPFASIGCCACLLLVEPAFVTTVNFTDSFCRWSSRCVWAQEHLMFSSIFLLTAAVRTEFTQLMGKCSQCKRHSTGHLLPGIPAYAPVSFVDN